MKKKKLKLNIEDEIVEAAAMDLCKRIDFGVLAGLLSDDGWVHVKAEGDIDVIELHDWVEQNAKDNYHNYHDEYVFKSKADANWFKLRWDSVPGDRLF